MLISQILFVSDIDLQVNYSLAISLYITLHSITEHAIEHEIHIKDLLSFHIEEVLQWLKVCCYIHV